MKRSACQPGGVKLHQTDHPGSRENVSTFPAVLKIVAAVRLQDTISRAPENLPIPARQCEDGIIARPTRHRIVALVRFDPVLAAKAEHLVAAGTGLRCGREDIHHTGKVYRGTLATPPVQNTLKLS